MQNVIQQSSFVLYKKSSFVLYTTSKKTGFATPAVLWYTNDMYAVVVMLPTHLRPISMGHRDASSKGDNHD